MDAAPVLEFVGEMQHAVLGAVFVDEARAFDVKAAVLSDLEEFAFAPPADGIEAVAGFTDAEGGGGDGIEADAVAEFLFDFDEQIEGARGVREVEDGVPGEDFVIEVDDIESDDEVGAQELIDESVDVFFGVDAIFAGGGGVGDAEGHSHVPFAVPAAGIVGGALGFEIEVDDVLGHGLGSGE